MGSGVLGLFFFPLGLFDFGGEGRSLMALEHGCEKMPQAMRGSLRPC